MVTTRKRRNAPARKRRRRARRNASYTPKINPTRKRRRRRTRRNYWPNDAAGHRKAARLGWKRRKASKAAKKAARKYKRKRKNPVYYAKSNPRRRRRNAYRRRRNPNGAMRGIRKALSRDWITRSLTISGGLISSVFAMPLVYRIVPTAQRDQARPFLGFVHVIIGAMMSTMLRNRWAKEMGIVIAGAGAYDLIQQNFRALNLPTLLRVENPLIDRFLPGTTAAEAASASYPVARRPVSSVAALSASYPTGAMKTVGLAGDGGWASDNPYDEIFE